MTKLDAYRRLCQMDREVSYVANLVFNYHSNAGKRLKAMVRLIDAGHEIRSGNTLDQVCIDGTIQSITALDYIEAIDHHA